MEAVSVSWGVRLGCFAAISVCLLCRCSALSRCMHTFARRDGEKTLFSSCVDYVWALSLHRD